VRVEQDHVGGVGAHDVADVVQRVRRFVERDRDRLYLAQQRVAVEIVHFQRLLDIVRIEFGELAQLPARRSRCPRTVDVEAQRRVADRGADRAGQREIRRFVEADLQLERRVAASPEVNGVGDALVEVAFEQVRADLDAVAPASTPQPVERLPAGLAERIPHRHFDGA
jgi:hypothetical protein